MSEFFFSKVEAESLGAAFMNALLVRNITDSNIAKQLGLSEWKIKEIKSGRIFTLDYKVYVRIHKFIEATGGIWINDKFGITKSLINRLETSRKEYGLSKASMSANLGMSRHMYYRIVNGITKYPTPEVLLSIHIWLKYNFPKPELGTMGVVRTQEQKSPPISHRNHAKVLREAIIDCTLDPAVAEELLRELLLYKCVNLLVISQKELGVKK